MGVFKMLLLAISYLALICVVIPLELSNVKRKPHFKRAVNRLYWGYICFILFFFFISLIFTISNTVAIVIFSLAAIILSILLVFIILRAS